MPPWIIVAGVAGFVLACYVVSRIFAEQRSRPESNERLPVRHSPEEAVADLVHRANDFDPNVRDEALGSLLPLGQAGWDAALRQIEGSMRIGVQSLRSMAQYAGDELAKKFLLHLMTSSNMTRRLDAAVALDGMGWAPDDHQQELLYFLAKREYKRLFDAGEPGKQLLVVAMKHEVIREPVSFFLHRVGELDWAIRTLCDQVESSADVLDRDGFQTLVEIGVDFAIPVLISVQDRCGDKQSAVLLLNCACRPLEEAAKSWAFKRGYQIVSSPGQTKKWGCLGLRHRGSEM